MNKTNFNTLKSTYPDLYKNIKSENEIQVSDGWYNLVFDLSKELELLCKNIKKSDYPYILEVKEKCGELRLNINYSKVEDLDFKNFLYATIMKYSTESLRTCTECGETGKVIVLDSKYYTRCINHLPIKATK